jgi:glutaredoxin
MQLKKMFITKGMNEFAFYFILCVLFVFLLFIMFDMLSFYFAYGVQEKSLFFGRQFDISSNNGTSELPQIAVQGNNIYVVWQDNTPGNYDIFFTHSSDNGNSFAPVLNLSNNSGTSELPQIAVQGNNIYVVWQDNTPGNYDILFKRSTNYGEGFRGVNLKNSNGTSQFPQIAVNGNNVYVVWQDNTPGNYDIFLQRTLSNGTKFKYRNLSNNNGTSELPQLSVSSNNIYVIWKDNNDTGVHKMFFKHGQKDNATGKIEYSNSYSLNQSGEPAQAKIVTGSEYFYGVWTTYLNKKDVSALEFYPFRLFGDNSGNSIPLTRLSLNESVSNPDIATRDDDAFLVWESTEAGNRDIFFKKLSRNFFERNN